MESLYEYVMDRLRQTKGSWPEVAAGSGVSVRTVEKIAREEIKDPGVSHIEKLAGYFRANKRTGQHLS
jgi:transcriptional regulator with XRE-family HTH domain